MTKEQARQKAIDWQANWDFDPDNTTMTELLKRQAYFRKLAKRHGLVREFRENGII